MSTRGALIDSIGRKHTNLRISITDRCNIRCFYCMPVENVQFKPRWELLSFEEIARFVQVVARMGINAVRITGGEPLVRAELPQLIQLLTRVRGIRDIALTTNGTLLAAQAKALQEAGLKRVNVSLDALSDETFRQIARRDCLDSVLEGIAVARQVGFHEIRLNAVSIRGITEAEIAPLATFARQHGLKLRFIEYMPLDAEGNWQSDHVLTGNEIRATLEQNFGPLLPVPHRQPGQTAVDYEFADGGGQVGFINPVTQPFCTDCNRLRLTAEGMIRNCLFSTVEWDARAVLRGGGSDQQLAQLVHDCVLAKKRGHGIDTPDFVQPQRAMYQIGG